MINNLNHELTNKCSSIVLVHLKGGKNFPSKNKLINKEVITLEQLITYIACNISSNTKVPSDIVIASMLKLKPTKVKYQCYMKRLGKEIKKNCIGEWFSYKYAIILMLHLYLARFSQGIWLQPCFWSYYLVHSVVEK